MAHLWVAEPSIPSVSFFLARGGSIIRKDEPCACMCNTIEHHANHGGGRDGKADTRLRSPAACLVMYPLGRITTLRNAHCTNTGCPRAFKLHSPNQARVGRYREYSPSFLAVAAHQIPSLVTFCARRLC